MSFGPILSQATVFSVADLAGVEVEGVGHDGVDGQHQLVAGLGQERLRHLDAVVLDQRAADLLALRLVEGEGHAAADDQRVDLGQERLDDVDLARRPWRRR